MTDPDDDVDHVLFSFLYVTSFFLSIFVSHSLLLQRVLFVLHSVGRRDLLLLRSPRSTRIKAREVAKARARVVDNQSRSRRHFGDCRGQRV